MKAEFSFQAFQIMSANAVVSIIVNNENKTVV